MRDFSNYHQDDIKQKLEHDGNLLLEANLSSYAASDVEINGLKTRAIVQGKTGDSNVEKRTIIGRRSEIKRGFYIKHSDLDWLVTSFPDDNGTYKKAIMQLCNTEITVTVQPEPIDYDDFGNPIYADSPSPPSELKIPCIAEKTMVAEDGDQVINLDEDRIKITTSYFEMSTTDFKVYDEWHVVKSQDKTKYVNGHGLLIFIAERKR